MKSRNVKRIMALFLMCLVMMLSINVVTVFAQQQDQQEVNQPEFVLTYPDGSTEPVETYEDAQAKLDEWKLLYEGKTDAKGLIELEGWSSKGEIKIVEKKVPEGYTAETTETIVDLSEGEVEIVNKKIEEPPVEEPKNDEELATTDDDNETVDSEEEPEKTTTKSKNVKTGDGSNVALWIELMLVSLGLGYVVLRSRRARNM